ncbi:MAG TPA: cytochrome c oxidase subunit 3 [Ideonella sp.]|uniref:cytochrome c oxidase subunit 3 n=1 Tax=Ideonella sp. TaxID=1929293 RepID=UPI002E31421C|nr:cytochrome c oxidase subunit 3 [Ideonella sp.]HEX5682991.1 cytochrome c oxidase subunit 3 [Ideonella sp.]
MPPRSLPVAAPRGGSRSGPAKPDPRTPLDAVEPDRARTTSTALWLFIGVATTFFSLFLVAYGMRMDAVDWSPIPMPPQLWLSTLLLLAGGVFMHFAGSTAAAGQGTRLKPMLIAGGAAAAAFVGSQLWGWQALIDQRVMLSGNPAASFFYVLTALHGLHVLGGLVAWSIAAQALSTPAAELRAVAWRVQLCARYWHFLFAVWLVLFAALALLTPEIVRYICGRS